MKKAGTLKFFITGLLCVSCTISPTLSPSVSLKTPAIIQTTQLSSNRSFRYRWEMVEQPNIGDDKVSFVAYAMKITGKASIIICSLEGSEADKFLNNPTTTIQIRDNTSNAKLQSKQKLGTIGKISFWSMQFAPHAIGASELYFLMGQDDSRSYYFDRLIAKFVEPPEAPSDFNTTRYLISVDQAFEQGGYRISFEGWAPPPSQIPITTVLPENTTVTERATLKIENLASAQNSYLYIQFLTNGDSVNEIIK